MSSLRWTPEQRLSQINREASERRFEDSTSLNYPRKGKTRKERENGTKNSYLQNRANRASDNRNRDRRAK